MLKKLKQSLEISKLKRFVIIVRPESQLERDSFYKRQFNIKEQIENLKPFKGVSRKIEAIIHGLGQVFFHSS